MLQTKSAAMCATMHIAFSPLLIASGNVTEFERLHVSGIFITFSPLLIASGNVTPAARPRFRKAISLSVRF